MTGEVKIRIGLDKPGVDDGLKQTDDNLKHIGDTATKAGSAAKPAIDSIGVSAKQTAAALRGVPAQFTDIVTALQAGQSPMTVMLQQGGQLKDMFGGIGPAAKALGGYLVGLISPTSIAAATIGALAYAYSQGSEEQAAFARTLTLTGNTAALTAGQLQTLSNDVAAATGATRGMAAETMNAMLATGKVAVDMLARTSQAAIDLERVADVSVAETVKQFSALGDDPVKASLKLNEQMHYLTAAVYDQIKALVEQGRASEAASVAQEAYASAIEARIPQLANNLGVLQRAWMAVRGAAKDAWDGMLNLGRPESLEQKIEAVNKAIEKAKKPNQIDNGESGLSTLEKQRDALLAQLNDQNRINFKIAEGNLNREYGLQQEVKTGELREKYLTKQQILDREILRINSSNLSVEEKRNAVLIARQNAFGKPREQKDPALEALFDRQEESTRLRKEAEDELRDLEKLNERKARAQQIVTNYNNQAAQTVERINRQKEMIGLGERETAVQEALYKVEDDAAQVRKEITQQIKDETDRTAALAAVDADLANKKAAVAAATREAFDATQTFSAGWDDAFTRYKDSAQNAAKTAGDAFRGFTSGADNLVKNFIKTGKVDLKSFGNSVIDTLAEIEMQTIRSKFLAPMMESAGNWFSGLGSGIASSLLGSAKGNVFSDSPSLHQYVNTVQTSPKMFSFGRLHAFAKGGVFAEEKPEAVMPLGRDSSGELGVKLKGGSIGGGMSVTIPQTYYIDARSDQASIMAAINQGKEAAKAEILASMQRGGVFARA